MRSHKVFSVFSHRTTVHAQGKSAVYTGHTHSHAFFVEATEETKENMEMHPLNFYRDSVFGFVAPQVLGECCMDTAKCTICYPRLIEKRPLKFLLERAPRP
ncbi:MAG: hypothetical protein CSA33_05170 [Desulfobulbus propionicus]|nr:MAG: hypothetical protein CSA33_05170 [Desulfobulbus propionicus]